jgi:photosystem II stability/assembly factor-like uncharacterized protein
LWARPANSARPRESSRLFSRRIKEPSMKFSPSSHVALAIFALTFAAGFALAQPASTDQAPKQFECMGIGGGGQMYGPGVSPHDPKLMHVSCDMGTFYRSTDGGLTWTMSNQLQMVGRQSCRPAYHPTDPDTVYMPYARGEVTQVRISRDRGKTWQVLCDDVPWGDPGRSNKAVRDKYEVGVIALSIDPNNPKLMFAATAVGLYRSTDGGKSFSKCEGIDGQALWVHFPAKDTCVAGSAAGVYTSADAGKSWTKKGKGLPEGLFGFAGGTDEDGKSTYYAVVGEKGVFVSRDDGETFTRADTGVDEGSRWRFVTMAADNPDIAYVSNFGKKWGVSKTTDGGKTWKQVFSQHGDNITWGWLGLDHTTGFGGRANSITACPSDPDIVVYVNTGELFITRNGGETWREHCSKYFGPDDDNREKGQSWGSVGLEVALPTNMVFDPFDRSRAYLIYGDIGFLISTDRGKSWRRSTDGIPRDWANRMWQMIPDPRRKGVLYAACAGAHGSRQDMEPVKYKGGVVMSTDGGESWTPISEGLPTDKAYTTDLVLDPDSPPDSRTLYTVVPTKGVYKSTDGGKSWTHKSQGLGRKENMNTEQLAMGPDGELYCLVIGRARGWDFRPFPPGGLWKSTDGAETWQEVTASTKITNPRYFAVDPTDSDRIFIGSTQAPNKEAAGLFATEDGGKSWKRILGAAELNAPQKLYGYVHSGDIVFHPSNSKLVYYSTKTHGLWFSRDGGKKWQRLLGIPRLATGKVIFDPRDPDTIYVCSVGLWKGPAEGFDAEDAPETSARKAEKP